MRYIERIQMLELELERTPAIARRIARRLLAGSLRKIGVPRADPIVTAVVHGAEIRLRKSHVLPNIVARHPFYDTALPTFVRLLRTKMDRVVRIIDVGANIGDTAKIIATQAGYKNVSFICVEADPLNITLLRENVRGLSASIVAAVASSTTSTQSFNFVRDHGTAYITPGSGELVPVVRLDDIVNNDRVHLVKIDTDGFELQVLQGLTATLSRDSPYLFIEMSPAHWELVGKYDPMLVFSFLKDAGYRCALLYDGYGYPMTVGDIDDRHLRQLISWGRARPVTWFDLLISKQAGELTSFYEAELCRVGRHQALF